MHDAAARGHELDVARPEAARAAGVIGMHELAREHKSHRLDAPVRMGRETSRRGEPVLGHHQERAVLGDAHGRNHHPGAMAFRPRLGRAGRLDGMDRELHEQTSQCPGFRSSGYFTPTPRPVPCSQRIPSPRKRGEGKNVVRSE